jgi:hypothetical protein
MTAQEFKAWTEETARSLYHWQSDPVSESRGEFLFYIGGEDGHFIQIMDTGKLLAGTYEGAMPHIGEALFKPTMVRDFPDVNSALQRVIECGGREFLFDFMKFRAYTTHTERKADNAHV